MKIVFEKKSLRTNETEQKQTDSRLRKDLRMF